MHGPDGGAVPTPVDESDDGHGPSKDDSAIGLGPVFPLALHGLGPFDSGTGHDYRGGCPRVTGENDDGDVHPDALGG